MVLKQDVSWGLDMIFSCTCWDKSLRYENGRPRSRPDANDNIMAKQIMFLLMA